jgi:hypothetical protein
VKVGVGVGVGVRVSVVVGVRMMVSVFRCRGDVFGVDAFSAGHLRVRPTARRSTPGPGGDSRPKPTFAHHRLEAYGAAALLTGLVRKHV